MIKIKRSKDGQYFVNITAPNGRILYHSETYRRKANALKGIAAAQRIFSQPLHHVVKDETE